MSTTLNWYPANRKGNNIDSLKRVIANRLEIHSGNLGIVGDDFIPFLEGIIAGNGSGDMGRDAKKLLDAIFKHGTVELIIEE